jgi:HPt (histidine-containing phosphotransfer) domain-containing protein
MDGIETLQRAKTMTDSPCQHTPFIALTANAVAGVKEMFLAKGFNDYLAKPVDGKTLEHMVQKYLPPEKIEAAGENPSTTSQQIDLPTAMQYCGNDEEMQKKFLSMFVTRREAVTKLLEKDLTADNIADYTTHVHALKSTALSIGGVKLSEAAKALEMAGHAYCDGPEEEKADNLQYIKEHHGEAMELYAKLADEAKVRFSIQS